MIHLAPLFNKTTDMPKPKLHSKIQLHGLELNLNLGWRTKERTEEQAVLLDLDICFSTPPVACLSDKLKDTVCYARLSDEIRERTSAKSYRLIEHLCADIYALSKKHTPEEAAIKVRITKYPRISGLKDGVSFEYGDIQSSW